MVEHVGVKIEADFLHFAGLRFAQDFARAANFEVVHGEEETRAELVHHLYRLQAFSRLHRQRFFAVGEQIGIGLMMRAADAAAQLVQLRQAELVGAVDQHGVGGGDVDAGLDDGRAKQQVVALLVEFAHRALEFALAHLAVRHHDARFGQQLGELRVHVLYRLDFVVQEIDLPAALQFAQHRFADHALAFAADESLDREALLRRGGNDREIAQTFERHGQRARDRRGRQREHVHFGAQRL